MIYAYNISATLLGTFLTAVLHSSPSKSAGLIEVSFMMPSQISPGYRAKSQPTNTGVTPYPQNDVRPLLIACQAPHFMYRYTIILCTDIRCTMYEGDLNQSSVFELDSEFGLVKF